MRTGNTIKNIDLACDLAESRQNVNLFNWPCLLIGEVAQTRFFFPAKGNNSRTCCKFKPGGVTAHKNLSIQTGGLMGVFTLAQWVFYTRVHVCVRMESVDIQL